MLTWNIASCTIQGITHTILPRAFSFIRTHLQEWGHCATINLDHLQISQAIYGTHVETHDGQYEAECSQYLAEGYEQCADWDDRCRHQQHQVGIQPASKKCNTPKLQCKINTITQNMSKMHSYTFGTYYRISVLYYIYVCFKGHNFKWLLSRERSFQGLY